MRSRLMRDRKLSAVPVVADGRVVGILTDIDVAGIAIERLPEHPVPAPYDR